MKIKSIAIKGVKGVALTGIVTYFVGKSLTTKVVKEVKDMKSFYNDVKGQVVNAVRKDKA